MTMMGIIAAEGAQTVKKIVETAENGSVRIAMMAEAEAVNETRSMSASTSAIKGASRGTTIAGAIMEDGGTRLMDGIKGSGVERAGGIAGTLGTGQVAVTTVVARALAAVMEARGAAISAATFPRVDASAVTAAAFRMVILPLRATGEDETT
jgi:hypothetical protein